MTDAPRPLRILGISGSLRARSFNTAALRAAGSMLPDGCAFEIAPIGDLPLYDQDLMDREGMPGPAARLRAQIAAADALILACPEYNYSVTAALKNAIDWASRGPDQPLNGKPVAILGASGGMIGTARAQYHLRQICVFVNMHPINKPEVMIGQAPTKFDADLTLTDEPTRKIVGDMVQALVAWTRRLSP
ncbi:MAG: NADPH-dependent FMN reductase [Rhodospirillales bacterium]|jgi:chromate reductase